jgi:hypothetical protein
MMMISRERYCPELFYIAQSSLSLHVLLLLTMGVGAKSCLFFSVDDEGEGPAIFILSVCPFLPYE